MSFFILIIHLKFNICNYLSIPNSRQNVHDFNNYSCFRRNYSAPSKDIKLFKPGTTKDEILKTAFSNRPFVTIGPVGWSNLKQDSIDPSACKMDYFSNNPLEQKKALQTAYENAYTRFMTPIYEYFKDIGMKIDEMATVSCFSNLGIDKAAMNFAKEKKLNLITVGPYRFAKYMPDKHFFPIVLTNTVSDYGSIFSDLSDILLVCGGRDHSWLFDTSNHFIGNKRTTIPVDLLDLYYELKIPASGPNRAIENSARMLKKLGVNPYDKETRVFFNNMPKQGKDKFEFDEQRALAAKMYEIYKAREKAASLVK